MLISRDLIVRKAAPGEAKLQIAYGAVYMPDVVDSQGDFMRADEIRKAAHDFLKRGTTDAVDTHHNNVKSGSYVVESFITKAGDPDFPIPGTWVVGIHVPDADLWAQIEKGDIGGLSMQVMANRIGNSDVAERALKSPIGAAKGVTYKTGDHEHEYEVSYGPDGSFLGGRTNEINGHFHLIKAGKTGVVTEEAADHRHRFSTLEHFEVVSAKADADDGHAPTNSFVRLMLAKDETEDYLSNQIAQLRSRASAHGESRSRELLGYAADYQRQLDSHRNTVRGANARDAAEQRSAGAANGRHWVKGFYRRSGGNDVWVRGHWRT